MQWMVLVGVEVLNVTDAATAEDDVRNRLALGLNGLVNLGVFGFEFRVVPALPKPLGKTSSPLDKDLGIMVGSTIVSVVSLATFDERGGFDGNDGVLKLGIPAVSSSALFMLFVEKDGIEDSSFNFTNRRVMEVGVDFCEIGVVFVLSPL